MDLGTVKQKIERKPGGYRNVNACVADIRLIWSNCKRYNGEGSDFYDLADRLSKRFEELFAKAKAEAKKRDRDAAAAAEEAWRAAQAKKCASPSTTSRPTWSVRLLRNCRSTLLWLKMGRSTNEMPLLSG